MFYQLQPLPADGRMFVRIKIGFFAQGESYINGLKGNKQQQNGSVEL